MAKKSFSAGVTKTGVLDNAGGAKIKEIQAKAQYNFQYIISNILQRKKYNPIQKMKNTRRMELNPLWKAFW